MGPYGRCPVMMSSWALSWCTCWKTMRARREDSSLSPTVHRQPFRMYIVFFQAKDGIRDLTVTGVQTCALPISPTCNTYAKNFGRDVVFEYTLPAGPNLDVTAVVTPQGGSNLLPVAYVRKPGQCTSASQIGRASCRERG